MLNSQKKIFLYLIKVCVLIRLILYNTERTSLIKYIIYDSVTKMGPDMPQKFANLLKKTLVE